MTSTTIILAKSKGYGGTTLLEHTRHVMKAVTHIANHLAPNQLQVLLKAAAIHDLGKAHPRFQARLREADGEKVWSSLWEKQRWDFVHRHELSSLLFLPVFDKEEWDHIIECVVSHHKSMENDRSKNGILDLVNCYGIDDVFENHSRNWDDWSPAAIDILRNLGFDARFIEKSEAFEAWSYTVEYCYEKLKLRHWSPMRGKLMAADHFASAMVDHTDHEIQKLFHIPNLTFFEPRESGGELFPLTDISTDDSRPHTLLVAPTGAGKTNFLMRRCQGRRVFYTLPFQASINAMWLRFKNALPETNVRVQHSASRLLLAEDDPKNFEQELPLHRLIGASVKVLTPHQLATIVLGLPGFEAAMIDVKGTAVILDEIHTYSSVSRSLVLEIVKALLKLDCTIHVGTATMPTAMYVHLLTMLGGRKDTYEVSLGPEKLASYNRHRLHKLREWTDAVAIVETAMRNQEKLLIVCNTVKKAQELYEQLKSHFGQYPHMLIHSRFRRKDRTWKEQRLRNEFEGKDGQGHRPCWVVATQVVEVSLDISFDRMITACAPIDSLIQRFGRINRRRTHETLGVLRPVHIVAPGGSQRPYENEVVQSTFDILPDHGEILTETSLQDRIDKVYPVMEPTTDIGAHIIWRNDDFLLPPLCNQSSAVLHDALEIDSATCILESDQEAYETGTWDEKVGLEIPVSYNVIGYSAQAKSYRQLDSGTRPFVVPQDEAEHLEIGLRLHDYDTFL